MECTKKEGGVKYFLCIFCVQPKEKSFSKNLHSSTLISNGIFSRGGARDCAGIDGIFTGEFERTFVVAAGFLGRKFADI